MSGCMLTKPCKRTCREHARKSPPLSEAELSSLGAVTSQKIEAEENRNTGDVKSDNTYSGDLNCNGMPKVWGSVMVSGNEVIFTDSVAAILSGERTADRL